MLLCSYKLKCEVMCVVHVKYCIIYWLWIWLVWHVGIVHASTSRKDIEMGVPKGTVL